MNHEEILVEAVHDLCEECMSKQHYQGICGDVERMKKLALDVRKEEQERCIKAAQKYMCEVLCIGFDENDYLCKKCEKRECVRKAMEGGSHES